MIDTTQLKRHDGIRLFLKTLRRRVPRDTTALGGHERLGSRRGRAVTQEELAEAVGVSRGWYARLENGVPIQPSVSMLSRLADALQATAGERTALFLMAIPGLQGAISEGLPAHHENVCPVCGGSAGAYTLSASSTARSKARSAPSAASAAMASAVS